MKTIRIILIFLMLLLPFGGWWYLISLYPPLGMNLLYPTPIFMGIGQIVLLIGFVILLILERWSELQIALKKEEAAKLDNEITFKKFNLEAQLDIAKQRMTHEARRQPDKEMATIINAAKTKQTNTKEFKKPGKKQSVPVKETIETETIDYKIVNNTNDHLGKSNTAGNP